MSVGWKNLWSVGFFQWIPRLLLVQFASSASMDVQYQLGLFLWCYDYFHAIKKFVLCSLISWRLSRFLSMDPGFRFLELFLIPCFFFFLHIFAVRGSLKLRASVLNGEPLPVPFLVLISAEIVVSWLKLFSWSLVSHSLSGWSSSGRSSSIPCWRFAGVSNWHCSKIKKLPGWNWHWWSNCMLTFTPYTRHSSRKWSNIQWTESLHFSFLMKIWW